MNVGRQERTRPETRDQSSCSPCAVNALCSISLVVWHYFWRPRRRRVAALLLWCMTRRDSFGSIVFGGFDIKTQWNFLCMPQSLAIFVLVVSYAVLWYFQLEGTGWQSLTNWGVRCFDSEFVQGRFFNGISKKGYWQQAWVRNRDMFWETFHERLALYAKSGICMYRTDKLANNT